MNKFVVSRLIVPATVLASVLAACGGDPAPAPAPAQPEMVGTWTGTLTNTTIKQTYNYRAVFNADGTVTVANEIGKVVTGAWTVSGSLVKTAFTLNSNAVRMQGDAISNVYAGSWTVVNLSDVGTFRLVKQ